MCAEGSLSKLSAAVISTGLRKGQVETKASCRPSYCMSRKSGGVSNLLWPGQLPGSSSFPSMAAPQTLSRHSVTDLAGQGVPAALLLGANSPNSCKHRNAMLDIQLLIRGPGGFWDLHGHFTGSREQVAFPNLSC